MSKLNTSILINNSNVNHLIDTIRLLDQIINQINHPKRQKIVTIPNWTKWVNAIPTLTNTIMTTMATSMISTLMTPTDLQRKSCSLPLTRAKIITKRGKPCPKIDKCMVRHITRISYTPERNRKKVRILINHMRC
jgi:hypothetical protein